MAGTFGYGLKGFAGGFQTGIGLGMENKRIKMLQEEQKRAEKLAKEKEENAMNWLNTNKENLMNFHTQSQDVRNMLILESINYKKEWNDYLRDIENFLQDGDLEGLKHLNDMEEERIKGERDMLGLGVRPENAFVGKYYDEKDMEYVKKLQMGKLPIKSIGTQMYEEEFGKLPVTPEAPGITDYKSAVDYLSKFINAPINTFNKIKAGFQSQFPDIDMSAITQESLREPEKVTEPTPEPTPAPTSTENIREDILNADTFEDAQRIYKNYDDKYDVNALGITDLKQEWTDNQISYLNKIFDKINASIRDLIDEKGHLRKGTITEEEIGVEFEGEQKIEDIYKMLREEYMKYRDMLEKLGVDVNQFPKIKSIEEIEKVGFWEGLWGWGKQRGQYKSIYK